MGPVHGANFRREWAVIYGLAAVMICEWPGSVPRWGIGWLVWFKNAPVMICEWPCDQEVLLQCVVGARADTKRKIIHRSNMFCRLNGCFPCLTHLFAHFLLSYRGCDGSGSPENVLVHSRHIPRTVRPHPLNDAPFHCHTNDLHVRLVVVDLVRSSSLYVPVIVRFNWKYLRVLTNILCQ